MYGLKITTSILAYYTFDCVSIMFVKVVWVYVSTPVKQFNISILSLKLIVIWKETENTTLAGLPFLQSKKLLPPIDL